MAIEGVYGVGEIHTGSKVRVLKDGSVAQELAEPMTLTIKTKCPEKYMLFDMETGEKYIGRPALGNSSWLKIHTET